MGLINYSNISDGTSIDANDVNNPFNTVYNEFNGNIEAANIKNGSITQEKLANYADVSWSNVPAANTVSSVTANGNRSYNITFGSSVASFLSPGMRIRTTRTVGAPTQCTSLNGTTQYYSRTSANLGSTMTFTDDFTVSAWVKMTSYGAESSIVTRFNGTSGWLLNINSSGQIYLNGSNAGSGNTSRVTSFQSIPLNKWVHVAAQLDMSAFTATTTTSYIMIDGVDVASAVTRTGTNPTSLIQAGNLEIGSSNSGTQFFPGKIAQVAIYSAKVTQATILASINQTLTGSETSLISAYSFNNSINDLNTTNANNLTASGSAVATDADSCFGYQADGTISSTLDYAIVSKVASTVLTVQVPEGCTIPTTGGVATVSYATVKTPYGFPGQRGKWEVGYLNNTTVNHGNTTNAFNNASSIGIYSPIGAWDIRVQGTLYIYNVGAGGLSGMTLFVGTANAAAGQLSKKLTNQTYIKPGTGQEYFWQVRMEDYIENTAARQLYINNFIDSGVTFTSVAWHAGSPTILGAALHISLVTSYL